MLEQMLSMGRKITPPFLMPLGKRAASALCSAAVAIKGRRLLPQILKYYQDRDVTAEQREVLDNLRQHGFNVFPYPNLYKTNPKDVQVLHDDALSLPYVMTGGKRLYFPADSSVNATRQNFFQEQIVSQHPESPHRYLTDDFCVQPDDIVVDCGAADGNFALEVVDKVKKIYLFEPAERWQKPLNATFAPWKEKVVIVGKYLSDETNDACVSLDDYFAASNEVPTMLKMDIEGFEGQALRSAKRLLQAKNGIRKVVVCTYHRQDDEKNLGAFLRECGFNTKPSKGYMLFVYDDDVKPPYLRRGIIRATKI